MEDNATVRTVFAEKQPFKGVENYFTDAFIYQEANKVVKEPLLEDDDSSNEADSESEEDTPTTLTFEPIVAYFNDSKCNNPIEDDCEWVINENVTFDYPVSVDDTSLLRPLSVISVTSTPVESGEGFVLVIPLSKRSQLPIVFSRVQPRMSAVKDWVRTQSPRNFFIMHDQHTI